MKKRLAAILAVAVLGLIGIAGMASAQVATTALPDRVESAVLEALTGPDGEYAAYASYAAVLETYGDVEPYATIAEAELRHIEALQRLLDKYGVAYPTMNPYLGSISAPADLSTAAQAWADGEVANVLLYDELLEKVGGYTDITRVFTNLRRASLEAHLPAFQLAAESGGTLVPEQIGDQAASSSCNGGKRYAAGNTGMIHGPGRK